MGTDNKDKNHINLNNKNKYADESLLQEEIASIMRYEADDDDEEIDEEELRLEEERFKEYQARITKRINEMKAEHERQLRKRNIIKAGAAIAAVSVAVVAAFNMIGSRLYAAKSVDEAAAAAYSSEETLEVSEAANDESSASSVASTECTVEEKQYIATETASTQEFGAEIVSSCGILMNADTLEIVSERNAYAKMYPASMTKVLTLLVAAEHLTPEQLEDTFEITIEITDYSYSNDCSAAGFDVGEDVKVKDLLYALILPSGADGALGLAYYIAGSQEDFVVMMNDKLEELGLSDTAHFTNCIGIYDDDHYCTAYDMAIIMRAALDNELCKEVLSTHYYVTEPTEEHPDGIELSNWFLRRIEDNDEGINVVCGKTGYVIQSGNCAVSYAEDDNGNSYILCTGNSQGSWQCIYDQTILYANAMSSDAVTDYAASAAESSSGGIDEE